MEHTTWWEAPLTATLIGLPLLVGEILMSGGIGGSTSVAEKLLYLAVVLLAVAWLLPRRRAWRVPRFVAAGSVLAITALPIVTAVLMGLAMTS
ncbi:hypothetical protein RGF97_23635 [Streptomyces roseicoloratus]|uniref:Uncharacterized protein n=1 Tax=Streptomyces roseicoloratus TaxID=2508722 RepID=A0ABY9S076_9ACTN|nr:hypothetical protein [Streptomyces roseicoloratus]WMX47206.1 hypothetical protein RGF97_23635 [Streptomyces roseicoloratus]